VGSDFSPQTLRPWYTESLLVRHCLLYVSVDSVLWRPNHRGVLFQAVFAFQLVYTKRSYESVDGVMYSWKYCTLF
jgi:hypothetical protein